MAGEKPAKPYEGFPLSAHANGQWCKKIKGTIRFFGVWADPDAALRKYLDERDDLQAGRTPRRLSGGLATTKDVVNAFLSQSEERVKGGDLSAVTLADYLFVGALMLDHLGRTTDPSKLGPGDFAAFRNAVAPLYSPSRLTKIITVTRTVFRWAGPDGRELIEKVPKYGPDFKPPTSKVHRVQKAKAGPMLFSAEEVRALIAVGRPMWTALVLLGINGGLGNTDVSTLRRDEIKGNWLNKARSKTGVPRRIPLWPQTIEAVEKWLAIRPEPLPENKGLVFVTRTGKALIRIRDDGDRTDLVVDGFGRLMEAARIHRPRMGFYWLRHTFQTIGDRAKDAVATSAIMGHLDSSMAANYREVVEDDRLLDVSNHVRAWLFGRDKSL